MQGSILAARRARALHHSRPSHEGEGAGKAGCRSHPWAPCNKKKHGGRTTGEPEQRRLSLRSGLRLIRVLPGVPGFLATVPPGLDPEVDPSVGRSGPHDFARPRGQAFVVRLNPRPPHPTATFVTCATPLLSGETGQAGSADLPDGLSGIFFSRRAGQALVICPSCYFVAVIAVRFCLRARRSSAQRSRS
jgi:hypothetical protein